jgi:hypothetical protein
MALHACLQGKEVVKIVNIENNDQYSEMIKDYTAILLIEDEAIRPNVGWTLEGLIWVQNEIAPHSFASVTPRQIKLALVRTGRQLADIENFIKALPEPTASEVFIWWSESKEFFRDNEVLNQTAPLMGFSSQDLDDLFVYASTL